MKFKFYTFYFSVGIFIVTLLSCHSLNAQNSDTFNSFVEQHSKGRTFYVYQSVFRLANIEGNADFNKLIKHVRCIKVHQFPIPDSTSTADLAKELFQIMNNDGYEELITYKEKNSTIRLTMKGDENKGAFLIFIFSKDGSYVAEMDGYFDLRYLGALASGSFSSLQELMGGKLMNFD